MTAPRSRAPAETRGGGDRTVMSRNPAASHMPTSARRLGAHQFVGSLFSSRPGKNSQAAIATQAGDLDRLGLDHGESAGSGEPGDPAQGAERILEVIEDSQEQDDIEAPEGCRIDGHEVADDRIDAAAQQRAHRFERPPARERRRLPVTGLVRRG